jgi:hypothetical protein
VLLEHLGIYISFADFVISELLYIQNFNTIRSVNG